MWVAQGIHHDVGHDLDIIRVRDIRILVKDEECVHEFTADAQRSYRSRMSKASLVAERVLTLAKQRIRKGGKEV